MSSTLHAFRRTVAASVVSQPRGKPVVTTTVRHKAKYLSKTASKYLPLSPKHAKKGYKKGNRCRSTGRVTSKGKFIVDPNKLVEVVAPDLTGFALKPYVAASVAKEKYPGPDALLRVVEYAAAASSSSSSSGGDAAAIGTAPAS